MTRQQLWKGIPSPTPLLKAAGLSQLPWKGGVVSVQPGRVCTLDLGCGVVSRHRGTGGRQCGQESIIAVQRGQSGGVQAIRLKEPHLKGEEASVWPQWLGQGPLGDLSQFLALSGRPLVHM